jgi:hypothetical protein
VSAERLIIETLFRIPDKNGADVDFLLNPEQAELDAALTGRDIIAKARQMGFSTYVLGLFLARCLMYRNRRCVLVSHDTGATQKLLSRIHYMLKYMKGAKADLKYSNQNFITFNKMDSTIYVGTAGASDFGVGDTISDLHCSEVSRWTNPGPLLSGLFQAVPTNGSIIIESTGRGTGNYFHRQCLKAADGSDDGFKLHFFDWLRRTEYSLPGTPEQDDALMDNLNVEFEEPDYVKNFNMTPGQVRWRRRKISELDHDLQQFKEQYPCSLAECFQATGASFFRKVNWVHNEQWQRLDPWTERLYDHPKIEHTYAAGCDVSGGVNLDASVLEIFDVGTGEQVLEFVNKRLDPVQFASRCADFLKEFQAYTNFERNNQGLAFAAKFVEIYPQHLIHRTKRSVLGRTKADQTELAKMSQWGEYTSVMSKPLMIGKLRSKMMEGSVTIYSTALRLEMDSFSEQPNGAIEAAQGCYDDRVMATSICVNVFEKAAHQGHALLRRQKAQRGKTVAETFQVGSLISELEGRYRSGDGGQLPIDAMTTDDWRGNVGGWA